MSLSVLHTLLHSPVWCLHYRLLPDGVAAVRSPSSVPSLLRLLSLSNKKQMGDFCSRLLPNGANSHYSVCKLCCSSPAPPRAPFCHLMCQGLCLMKMCHFDTGACLLIAIGYQHVKTSRYTCAGETSGANI